MWKVEIARILWLLSVMARSTPSSAEIAWFIWHRMSGVPWENECLVWKFTLSTTSTKKSSLSAAVGYVHSTHTKTILIIVWKSSVISKMCWREWEDEDEKKRKENKIGKENFWQKSKGANLCWWEEKSEKHIFLKTPLLLETRDRWNGMISIAKNCFTARLNTSKFTYYIPNH